MSPAALPNKKGQLLMKQFNHYNDLIIKKSSIHGLGVFTPVKIEKDSFIMEYMGEIIGKCMSDKREKIYRQNSIESIYMFTVSEDMVIDATVKGNKARYINHSCKPNCEAITSIADKSIKYCSVREIEEGEELTIDYNMGKGLCNCGECELS